jgi:hypothetical protein
VPKRSTNVAAYEPGARTPRQFLVASLHDPDGEGAGAEEAAVDVAGPVDVA